MIKAAADLSNLEQGAVNWFAEWPCGNVPRVGSGVYTIWDRLGGFLYVGMSGRRGSSPNGGGPYTRLNSHASGRRSGDQFCIYVSDRLVLPRLSNRIMEVADGSLSLDRETKAFIREKLGFRFISVPDHATAFEVERRVKRGALSSGPPLLNGITENQRAR